MSETRIRSPHPRGMRLALLALTLASVSVVAAQERDADAEVEEARPDIVHAETSILGSDKLLLTAGVSQIEGSAGGGLTPWAVIGGYGTRDQIGGSAFYTHIAISDYQLDGAGVMLGLFDRVELSLARQRFDTRDVGAALGLGRGFTFTQEIVGAKVRLLGSTVFDQDRWLPQISLGVQYKRNDRGEVLSAIGAKDDQGTDVYLSATKLLLGSSLLLNGTLRFTEANQTGILGFGGDRHDNYRAQGEFAASYLLSRHLAIGAEYRMKPDNLSIAKEDDWYDVFLAWAPNKHVSLTLAYSKLGNIVIADQQRGVYASLQIGF